MRLKKRNDLLLFILLLLFTVLMLDRSMIIGEQNRKKQMNIGDPSYRKDFFNEEMRENKEDLSHECKTFLEQVEKDSIYFPVPLSWKNPDINVSYINSWNSERFYRKESLHEGTDIMSNENVPGQIPIVSISDGIITNIGWLELGGYRIGIRSPEGVYYYYAHLDSYSSVKEGDTVYAGQFLGYMGNTGYGEEGTEGKFPVHLHLGIYFQTESEEISVNPYYLLKVLEKKKLYYGYS